MAENDNDMRDMENISIDIAAVSDVTFHILGTGTEDATNIYLNKGSMGSGVVIRPDKNIEIVTISGKTYRDPIAVSTAGWTQTKIKDFSEIILRTLAANTHIELTVL